MQFGQGYPLDGNPEFRKWSQWVSGNAAEALDVNLDLDPTLDIDGDERGGQPQGPGVACRLSLVGFARFWTFRPNKCAALRINVQPGRDRPIASARQRRADRAVKASGISSGGVSIRVASQ